MDPSVFLFGAIAVVTEEAALFAAVGFLILGLGDLAVDLIWLALACTGRLAGPLGPCRTVADLPPARAPGNIAVFVPAWDEAMVIGPMLRNTISAFGPADYRVYVGCYYNDPATIAAAREMACDRIRIVVGSVGIM